MPRLSSKIIAQFFILAAAALPVAAQEFQPYPGSKLDEKAGRQASSIAKNKECRVYATGDSFEKVYSFYKARYREITSPFPRQKLPNGTDVKWAFFVLDDGKTLSRSRFWMKIQRPYIGDVDDAAEFKDVRDVSVIQTVRTLSAN